ncbi:MAG: hypothetical protein B6U86_06315 [Candidatus Altiarchaeales archaeon ex4484_43]|nr:MAG: hypothetical protein B6U86_06315 [Candidatus Altiarchaeales archaeon ex4484_43]
MKYDVIVVGAGPAGSTAGRQCALKGLKTLILEKEKLPRYKPCGGGVTDQEGADREGMLWCPTSLWKV